jgi:hypothetical protein
MIQTYKVHPLQSRVGDLVAGLKALEKDLITTAKVSDLLTQMPLSPEALIPYLLWNPERYARNLIYRDQTTHRLENVEASRYGSVSLHVYSKPIDSAVLFDAVNRCCARRRMEYYSANGSVLRKAPVREEQFADAA